MDELLNSDNAEQENVVDSQEVDNTESVDIVDDSQSGSSEDINSQSNEKPTQNSKTNKVFAEMRKKAEKAEKDLSIARNYGRDYGVFSEEDIAAQYGAYGIFNLEQFETALMNEQYRQAGIDPNMINKLIESHPAIQQAKTQQTQAMLDTEFDELKRDFPDCGIKDWNDLFNLPNYGKIYEKIQKGYSISDAYATVNKSQIVSKAKESAKQKTLNDIGSKKHLNTEGDGSGDAVDVHIPEDTLQMYLDMGMTPAQAQKHHKKLYG